MPAVSNITIRITNANNGKYLLAVTDMQGKTVVQNVLNINSPMFSQSIDVARLGKGVYFSRLTDGAGNTIWVSKFIKE